MPALLDTSPPGPPTRATDDRKLSRERILDAAMAIAVAEGPAAVSMRRIAADLGTGAMSLYNHVPDKAALMEGLAEQVLAPVAVPDGPDQRTVLEGWATSLRATLLANRRLVPLVVSTQRARALTRLSARVHRQLVQLGGGEDQARELVRIVGRLVAGAVLLDAATLRRRATARPDLDATFDLALTALLDGLSPSPAAASHRPRSSDPPSPGG
jgi:AcrR family transcriptional regulator